MKMLIQLHLREKHELYEAQTALQEALQQKKSIAEVQHILNAVDSLRSHDAAVNNVLVLSAQAEIDRLRDELTHVKSQLHADEGKKEDAVSVKGVKDTLDNNAHEETERRNSTPCIQKDTLPYEEATKNDANSSLSTADTGTVTCLECHKLREELARATSEALMSQRHATALTANVQELKERFAAGEKAQRDLLRVAQDGRLEAEKAREVAEERIRSLKQQVDTMHRAEEASQRAQTSRNDTKIAELQRHVSLLEKKVASAEAAALKSNAEARELEHIANERDGLASRLTVTESKLEELRATSLSSTGWKEMLVESERKREAAEEELVMTAKLAASLEERLADATAAAEQASLEAQRARKEAKSAVAAIDDGIHARWRDAGSDRSKWPETAANEIEAVEARLASLQSSLKSLQEDARRAEEEGRHAKESAIHAEGRAQEAESRLEQWRSTSENKERRLEAAILAATQQADDCRSALVSVQRERDMLLEEKRNKEKATAEAAAVVASARQRGGGGGVLAFRDHGLSAEKIDRKYSNTGERDGSLTETDIIYLKNVLLKFVAAQFDGRYQECEVLLPAVAAVLRASPAEFKSLKESLARSSSTLGWLLASNGGGGGGAS